MIFKSHPGDKALRQIIDESRKIADRCSQPEDRDAILRRAGDVEAMANALSELRQQGKVGLIPIEFRQIFSTLFKFYH